MNSPRRNAAAGRGGFTLIEGAIVLLIAGLFAAAAAPKFAQFLEANRLDAAVRRIRSDLALAQARAEATGAPQTVAFVLPPDGNEYILCGMTDPDRGAAEHVVRLSDEPYGATLHAAEFGGDATVAFNGFGAPDSGGQVVVGRGGQTRAIVLDPLTGATRVP